MQLDLYRMAFRKYLETEETAAFIEEAIALTQEAKRLIFIGNGGSNSITSHMMEDFIKVARIPAVSFTDPSLITCFANDYGYEHSIQEWLRVIYQPGDLLYAISSSGKSQNILNATYFMKEQGEKVITLTGFLPDNPLSQVGHVNYNIPVTSYGIVECFHQTLIHLILDTLTQPNPELA